MKRKPKRYLIVDLETTGNQAARDDRIIQFAAVLVEDKQIVQRFSTFINPLKAIPPFIRELTGIEAKDVADAPLFEDVADTIYALLEGTIFVAHNVQFDWTFLQKEMRRVGLTPPRIPLLDTVELARILYPEVDSYKLQDLGDEFELQHDNPHQADSDAEVTALLFIQLLEKIERLPLALIEKLVAVSAPLKNHLPTLFFEMEMKKTQLKEALSDDLILHRGLVIRKKVLPPHRSQSNEKTAGFPKEESGKLALFERAGAPLRARSGQFEMMNVVNQAMHEKKHALIEAGTGIGKSLGYFLPAVYFAKESSGPVVISTYTNVLQTQLFEKDVPLARILSGFDVKAELLKGRDHYLNLFKFEQLLSETDTQYDVVVTKLKLLVWLSETETGDIDEVNLSSGGALFWNRLKHTGWYLSEEQDPWLEHDFYRFSLLKAKRADLLIVNHALLLADHFNERKILPDYSVAVIDEAHHFAESAREKKSFILSYRKVKYFLNQLGSLDKYSLLSRLAFVFPNEDNVFDLSIAQVNLSEAVENFFAELHSLLSKTRKADTKLILIQNREQVHFTESLSYAADNVAILFREVERHLTKLLEKAKHEAPLKEAESAFIEEVYSFLLDWKKMTREFDLLQDESDEMMTITLESDKNHHVASLKLIGSYMTPEEVLRNQFFSKKESVILTSATLTVNGSFAYLKNELGLTDEDLIEAQIPSPFHYNDQARILIPNDMPQIKGTPVQEYTKVLADYLTDMLQITAGKMLILFTSNEMLRLTNSYLKGRDELAEFMILAQGISSGSVNRLTKQFRQFDKAVLLGTTSFWEGIDIPGEALSCLVIVRLPFAPPDDPYTKAQIELHKMRGENAFQAFSLPQAVLRFKQGFGRLIRRETDRGLVVVFDNRVDTTVFGQTFLNSIPPVPEIKGNKPLLLEEMQDFFWQ
ncbi:bifunctional ATP-dependent DNA helicase/DNA polymerase III subunit epsilon [Listeria floridensis FSL S10-1187]|uniref:3'-5' exonuclease DinG n=1 Tax=Listeria floridensis FSL S10-1187 TaxID=1265817 RepID=A0ABP3AZF8_9LIST|nr:ATP-dependent DNA helicase DinG [Listeria floridensis]EUJ32961.1 bifunctional ATP-dependent DNA helicase/DNA polymerase III subunit epsilon [Listeria floridensis FSL S10-1187]